MSRPARRDPVGRRAAILDATLTVIARDGIARTSHRAIAREADVPLGSTTYYFPSLQAVVGEALDVCMTRMVEQLATWSARLNNTDDLATEIAQLTHEYYIADHERALVEYELYLAAARTPQLRPAARAWADGLRELLATHTGRPAAVAITALIDGFLVDAIATGEAVSRDDLVAAINTCLR